MKPFQRMTRQLCIAVSFLVVSLMVASAVAVMPVHAAESTDAAAKGSVVTDQQVKKTLDEAVTTSTPTVNPQTKTDVPATNLYENSTFHQPPIYIDGKIANTPGTNASIGGQTIDAESGQILSNEFIKPQHADEIIVGGDFDGAVVWMVGVSTDNSTLYVYKVDAMSKEIISQFSAPAVSSASFDPSWSHSETNDGFATTVSWRKTRLAFSTVKGTTTQEISFALLYRITVPVKFVDTAGNEIAKGTTVTGFDGTYVDVDVPQIEGYRLVSVPFMNDEHQYFIDRTQPTIPTKQYEKTVDGPSLKVYEKVLDEKGTISRYMTVFVSQTARANGVPDYTSQPETLSASPYGGNAIAFSAGGYVGSATVTMPKPVGGQLTFVYEPIDSKELTINYLEKGTGKVLYKQYKDTGTGFYDVVSPVLSGYEADTLDVSGVLTKDTTIDVYYLSAEPEEPEESTPPTKTVTTPPTKATTPPTKPVSPTPVPALSASVKTKTVTAKLTPDAEELAATGTETMWGGVLAVAFLAAGMVLVQVRRKSASSKHVA